MPRILLGLVLVLLLVGIGSYFAYPAKARECNPSPSQGTHSTQVTARARHPILFWWEEEFRWACMTPQGWVIK